MSSITTEIGPSTTSLISATGSIPYSTPTGFPTANGTYMTSSPTSILSGNNTIPSSTLYTSTPTTSNEPIFPSDWGFGSGGSDLIVNGARNTSSLSVQFVICFVAGLIFFLAFCFLRTRIPVIFAPRANMKRHKPPELPNSYFGWIIPLFKISTEELLLNIGLDAVLMLQFLLMGIKIFGICSLFGVVVLIPISVTSAGNNQNLTAVDKIAVTAVPDGSHKLIAYLVFAYFVTFVTFFFLTQSYYSYIYIHAKYLLNQAKQMVSRSVIVTGIPNKLRTDQALTEYYENLQIGSVENCYVVRNVHKLNKLIKQRASALIKLEEAYAKYWGNPCKIPGYDPERILDDVEMYKKILDEAEKKSDESSDNSDNESGNKKNFALRLTKRNTWKRAANNTFVKSLMEPLDQRKKSRRPTVRTGFLGLFGPKVDAIEYYTGLFDNLDKAVIDLRASPNYEMTNVAFLTFNNMSASVIASQIAIHPEPFACRTIMAYEPRDVLWSSISIRGRERILREIVVWAITVVLIIFWFVPVVLLSSLMSVNMIRKIAPNVADAIQQNAATSNFMTSFVPTVVLNIVTAVLPLIFDVLGYYQGLRSRSAIAESTLSKYFFFLVFFTLIVFTLAGTSIETVMLSFANDPSSIPEKLAATFPSIAPFFINYTILQGFLMMPMNLLLLGSLIVRGFTHVFLCKTPREHAENRTPWSFNYGIGYPVPLLIFIVVLEYSCISPLILLFGTIYFCFTYIVYKYQFLYVYFRPYEAAGRLWIMTIPRVIFGLILFQLTMTGLFIVKSSYILGILCVPLIVITLIYKFILDRAFLQNARNLPMQLLQDNLQTLPSTQEPFDNEDDEDDNEATQTNEQADNEEEQSLSNEKNAATEATDTENQRSKAIRNRLRTAALSAIQPKPETTGSAQNSNSTMIVRPRHRKVVLDEDDYEAVPDRLTDYRQPPMQLNPGLLDTGLKKFGNPLLVGYLPQLWLPVKEPRQASKEGMGTPSARRNSSSLRQGSEGGGSLAQHLADVLRKMEMETKIKRNMKDGNVDQKVEEAEKKEYETRARKANNNAHDEFAAVTEDRPNKHTSALRSLFKKGALKKTVGASDNDQMTNDIDAQQKGETVEKDEAPTSKNDNGYILTQSSNLHSNQPNPNTDHSSIRPRTQNSGTSTPILSRADEGSPEEYEGTDDSFANRPQNKRLSSLPLIEKEKNE